MASFAHLRAAVTVAALCAALGAASPLSAQQGTGDSISTPVLHTPPADHTSLGTTITLTRVVEIPVVVHDKHGALISNLDQSSLQLWVDKKPAAINSFTRDSHLPLTVGLIVDVSSTQREALEEERKASAAFFDDILSASGTAFVAQYGRQIDLLQDTTNSRAKLQQALEQLATAAPGTDTADSSPSTGQNPNNGGNNPSNPGNNGPYGRPGWPGGGGNSRGSSVPSVGIPPRANTVLYDALYLSSEEVMSKQAGRKVLIVLSDGADRGSKEPLASAIEAAQRADTVVYAIYVKGRDEYQKQRSRSGGVTMGGPVDCDPMGYPGGYPPYGYPGGYPGGYPDDCTPGSGPTGPVESSDTRKILRRITDQTGGRLFEMDKKDSLAGIYKQIGDELRAQYRLTYAPDKDASSNGYHRVDVSLKGDPKDLFVQTREGYYLGPED